MYGENGVRDNYTKGRSARNVAHAYVYSDTVSSVSY